MAEVIVSDVVRCDQCVFVRVCVYQGRIWMTMDVGDEGS